MTRIDETFEELSSFKRKALITYIVAGDPNVNITLSSMHLMVENGADIIELGVPFSDPMAEGPSIQKGHERALKMKTTLDDILEIVGDFRLKDTKTPVVLMGYFNPFSAFGLNNFFKAALKSGVDGVLVVDMPPEESATFSQLAIKYDVDIIRLIAPTTGIERAKNILKSASGYIYYVSLNGVTGSSKFKIDEVEEKLKDLHEITKLPIVVGFGIKDKKTVKVAANISAGVVVGSVLVDIMEGSHTRKDLKNSLAIKITELSSGLRE